MRAISATCRLTLMPSILQLQLLATPHPPPSALHQPLSQHPANPPARPSNKLHYRQLRIRHEGLPAGATPPPSRSPPPPSAPPAQVPKPRPATTSSVNQPKPCAPPPPPPQPKPQATPKPPTPLQSGANPPQPRTAPAPSGFFGLFSTSSPPPQQQPAPAPRQSLKPPSTLSTTPLRPPLSQPIPVSMFPGPSGSPSPAQSRVDRQQDPPPVAVNMDSRVPAASPSPSRPSTSTVSSLSYNHWQPCTAEEEDRALAMALDASINGPNPHVHRPGNKGTLQEEEDKALAMALDASINGVPPPSARNIAQEEEDRAMALALDAAINIQQQTPSPPHPPPLAPSSAYYPYAPPYSPYPPPPPPCSPYSPPPPPPPPQPPLVASVPSVQGSPPNNNDPSSCPGCGRAVGFFDISTSVQARKWHQSCLKCQRPECLQSLVGMTFAISSEGKPYHPQCHKILFHPRCCICEDFIPELSTGVIQFKENRFWRQRYCTSHEAAAVKCCSCIRVQPRSTPAPFVDLNDQGRHLCLECVSSIVLDTNDAQPLYREVLAFYRSMGMEFAHDIPLLLVDSRTLNEYGSKEGRTLSGEGPIFHVRGLMLAEIHHSVPSIVRGFGSFGVTSIMSPIRRTAPASATARVTGILVLYGLPRLLTGSILAHELFHAWLKMRGVISLDPQAEEGVCQLMAYLWLDTQHRILAEKRDEMQIKLASYFSLEIREDQSNVYGEGFRIAYEAFQKHGGGLPGVTGVVNSLLMTGKADSHPN